MDLKKRLNYDGSKEAKLSIILDVLVLAVFIFWGLYVVNNVFGKGVDDGLAEIECFMTQAEYHNSVWNNTDFVFGSSDILLGMNQSEIMKRLLEKNFTISNKSGRTIGQLS
jgi:hypothetical protein